MKRKKTTVGLDLIRRLAEEGDRIFSTERARQLASEVGLREQYLPEALYLLRQNGWIVSIRRGLYALSSTSLGITPVHEYEIAMFLVNPAAISHWTALHYHGLTEQIPRWVYVLTTNEVSVPRIRGRKREDTDTGYPVGGTIYRFVQVKPERFFGVEQVWIAESRISLTDPERTLIDGLLMPKYFGDFSEVLHAFEQRLPELNMDRICAYAGRLDVVVSKRLGWVLESLNIESEYLNALPKRLSSGFQKLDPSGPDHGPYNRRWMIRENLPGKVKT